MKSINAAPPRPGHHITCRDIWMPQVYYYFNRMKVFDYILTAISRENFSFFFNARVVTSSVVVGTYKHIIQNVHSFVSNFLGLLFSDVVVVVVIIVVIVLVSFVIGVIHSC